MTKKYKILFITDIHQNIDGIKSINFSQYDAVICGGDIIEPTAPDIEKAFNILKMFPSETFIVPGNCDKYDELTLYMKNRFNYIHLQKKPLTIGSNEIAGVGYSRSLIEDMSIYRDYFMEDKQRIAKIQGSGIGGFVLKFSGIDYKNGEIALTDPDDIFRNNKTFFERFVSFDEEDLDRSLSDIKNLDNGILLTHSPPYGTLDMLNGLPHIGSKTILKHIKRLRPRLVLCGHFHELPGQSEIDGITTVYNPGAMKEGFYGEITTDFKEYKIETKKVSS